MTMDWRSLPKAELHIHLLGAIPADVVNALLARDYLDELSQHYTEEQIQGIGEVAPHLLPLLEGRGQVIDGVFSLPDGCTGAEQLCRFETFIGFLVSYGFVAGLIRTADDWAFLARRVAEELQREGIVYAEILCSLPTYLSHQLDEAAAETAFAAAARVEGIEVKWMIDLVRDYGAESAIENVHRLLAWKHPDIVGIHLGGSERDHPPEAFAEAFRIARDGGLRCAAHAGEACGAESIWGVLDCLQVERIGHGIRAVDSERLLQELVTRDVALEVCPSSNVATGVVSSIATHPLPALLDAGVTVTLGSDDPFFFATSLLGEIECLQQMGLDDEKILAIMRNGFERSFLPPAERTRYLQHFDRVLTRLKP